MKKKDMIILGLAVVLLVLVIFSVIASNKVSKMEEKFKIMERNIVGTLMFLNDSEWRCAGKECNEWVTGADWVSDNCRPVGENNVMMCSIAEGGINVGGVRVGGEVNDYPLSEIDTSKVKSCRQPVCGGNILIKGVRR